MPKAADLRLHAYRHNALHGSVKMAQRNMGNILHSTSATNRAMELAAAADKILTDLADELYAFRREPDGTISRPKHAGAEAVERIRRGE